ncbi:hypothetical protein D9758_007844 [Tetrapyrgos nigripes]|uniref:Helicase C-terminal domain-containing protein n=1 Tax=Tetrapyrgos nigripes TaxID=182062 RepID=A0A8H5CZ24_9AGAR|nr:hypothetical protein D9758_007844 [Tetrapyrgos nigripes]
MVKAKAQLKGQKKLESFFLKSKDAEDDVNSESSASGQEEEADDKPPSVVAKKRTKKAPTPHSSDDERAPTTKKKRAKKAPTPDSSDDESALVAKKDTKSRAPDSSHLPPIHDIPLIFSDLVSRIPKIKDVAERVSGRKIRVATMCSGTESPLLALELIQDSIREHFDVNLEVEHVFSCEIEPFKQAYIERNFHPPILFRDVCELGGDEAHTAYGSLVPVPGDVDLLVAGTSCVDYSSLNNEKQDIEANGESGRTFRGMLSWVKKHRPPLVILENVCGAPWGFVKSKFEQNGYSADYSRVDTKQFYIPHTRTRVYLVAVDKKKSSIPATWKDMVLNKLKRPASSTLDAFLLPSDDPRIHSQRALDRRSGRTDWTRCESRHQRARLEEELGSKRPLTSWDEGGSCKLLDFAWTDWGVAQVERVWDLMDISLLRAAKKGVDSSYKTQVWNLSQNVDRNTSSSKVGICPCLTPSMIPYITNRGGPMVGLEALSMQGLPVDKLLLTRESEDNLADLAGNAMSTTVVGASILAALVTGMNLLKEGGDKTTYESKRGIEDAVDEDVMDVDEVVDSGPSLEEHIAGEDQLLYQPLDLSVTKAHSFATILELAAKSTRLCTCEGRVEMTSRTLVRCVDCGASSCKKCGGRPEHNTVPIDLEAEPRLSPSDFDKVLKSSLPMCLTLSSVDQQLLDNLKEETGADIPPERWEGWRAAVLRISDSELRFTELKRQEIWSAVYRSPVAMLELLLHPQQPEWRLYAKPLDSEPVNAEIRRVLEAPVGRLSCKSELLEGRWEFALPETSHTNITIKGTGELVPAWEARLGLISEEFKEKKVPSALEISCADTDVERFGRDISGTYRLLDKCGTANGALHKRQPKEDESSIPPLFMLFDPHRTDESEDCFVFSISTRRYEYGETRPIIAKLDSKWRQSDDMGEQELSCIFPVRWVFTDVAELKPSHHEDAQFGIPDKKLEFSVSNDTCSSAIALLSCSVPLHGQAGPEWPRGVWKEVDKIHERSIFGSIAWLLERVRRVEDNFVDWQVVDMPDGQSICERCAPTPPKVEYIVANKKTLMIEDPVQAGEYERRLKRRPSAFVTQLRLQEDGTGVIRVGVNIPSLLHRALSRLPSAGRTEPPTLLWRLNTNFTPAATWSPPKFTLMSNKKDKQHAQPPSFKIPLRKEQLRSLEWMLRQESKDAEPFIEEEVSEAILDPLGWRAEGRAQRPVRIRGGVLADQVGYGKTAITLGLIDCNWKDTEKDFSKLGHVEGKIALKATLIIVPPHLTRQWDSEVRKFTGKKRFQTLVLSTLANLNSATIEDFQNADLIIVASSIFKSVNYLENLSQLAGAADFPTKEGRHFNDHLQKVSESLRQQTERLQNEGSTAVKVAIQEAQKRGTLSAFLEDDVSLSIPAAEIEAELESKAQSKRLKGKSYREQAEKLDVEQAPKDDKPQDSVSETKVNSEEVDSGAEPETKKKKTRLVVEVVIPTKRSKSMTSSAASSAASSSAAEEDDSDAPKKRTSRAATRKVIVVSDDEDEDEIPAKRRKVSSRRRKPVRSDDDDDSFAEESDGDEDEDEDDASMVVDSSEDDEPQSKKSKKRPVKKLPKKLPRKASSPPTSTTGTDDDSMEVDAPSSKAPKRKAKAKDDGDRPVKKQKRAKSDPWKLDSAAVRREWTEMHAPPLEMFHFARKVIDEYTYLDGKVHSLVTNLTSERLWVLSGTPPLKDFSSLKTISAFLNVHLGIDDDAEGTAAAIRKRRLQQTSVEQFHSYREVHTLEWHAHRHELGQRFLDQFVRQNIAEIDEIPWTEKVVDVTLPAAERAIYLELEHYLRALEMTVKRTRKSESDREKRVSKSLGDSKSAEEALLKRCSHFDLETSNENAMKACDIIVKDRHTQLEECKADLLKSVKEGIKREKALDHIGGESMFHEWARVCRTEGVDDKDATETIRSIIKEAGVPPIKTKIKKEEEKLSEKLKEQKFEHREKTHEIRRLTRELVGRVRSLRFFSVVRDLQKQSEKQPKLHCPACGRDNLPVEEAAVLSSCGHTGCFDCVKACAEKEECVYAESGACKSAARVLNIIKAETLGVDDKARDGNGRHFGRKLEMVVDLIKKQIPKDDRLLIFVQFSDLMQKVAEALAHHKIQYLEIKGTASQKSKNLEKFQNDSAERVLLLNVMDESASGANLTSANHAIFLSPLLTQSQEEYTACETQAIGRVVRYGQTKHVYVHRFLTKSTIDEEVFDQRKAAALV